MLSFKFEFLVLLTPVCPADPILEWGARMYQRA